MVTLPLVLLAIPSLAIGGIAVRWIDYGHFFNGAIVNRVGDSPLVLGAGEFHGAWHFFLQGFAGPAFYLILAGIAITWGCYIWRPEWPVLLRKWLWPVAELLERKYFVDDVYILGFARGARDAGLALWHGIDAGVIDGAAVNGTARLVGLGARVLRRIQSGYLYHYAFAMIIGLAVMVGWLVWR